MSGVPEKLLLYFFFNIRKRRPLRESKRKTDKESLLYCHDIYAISISTLLPIGIHSPHDIGIVAE